MKMTKNAPVVPLEPRTRSDQLIEADLSDMLSELRILLPGAQMLTAFLIILPFNGSFAGTLQSEKILFLATFVLSLTSLVLLTAPAIQHRLMRPLNDRGRFKRVATRQIVAGSFTLALAFTLGTNMVISTVAGPTVGAIGAALTAFVIVLVWWALPMYLKRNHNI